MLVRRPWRLAPEREGCTPPQRILGMLAAVEYPRRHQEAELDKASMHVRNGQFQAVTFTLLFDSLASGTDRVSEPYPSVAPPVTLSGGEAIVSNAGFSHELLPMRVQPARHSRARMPYTMKHRSRRCQRGAYKAKRVRQGAATSRAILSKTERVACQQHPLPSTEQIGRVGSRRAQHELRGCGRPSEWCPRCDSRAAGRHSPAAGRERP